MKRITFGRYFTEGGDRMRHPHHFLAKLGLLLLTIGAISTLTGPALAMAPEIKPVDDSFSFTLDFCRFPIEATTRITGTETHFFDEQGNVLRDVLHLFAYAVWTNPRSGKSVIERDHLTSVIFADDEGFAEIGLNFHVSLPGGRTVLIDAGKVVFDSEGDVVFQAGKHQIEDGDVGGVCAALR
jgi:hypothetical protein